MCHDLQEVKSIVTVKFDVALGVDIRHRSTLAASIMLRSRAVLPGLEKSMRFRTVPLTMIQ